MITVTTAADVKQITLGAQYIVDVDEPDPERRIAPAVLRRIEQLEKLVDDHIAGLIREASKPPAKPAATVKKSQQLPKTATTAVKKTNTAARTNAKRSNNRRTRPKS